MTKLVLGRPKGSTRVPSNPDVRKRPADYSREYRQRNRWRMHGLTNEEFDNILDGQGGGCIGCGSTKNLQVDHDHTCCPGTYSCGKCVRGIACQRCNSILGFAQDSPELLRALASYVER